MNMHYRSLGAAVGGSSSSNRRSAHRRRPGRKDLHREGERRKVNLGAYVIRVRKTMYFSLRKLSFKKRTTHTTADRKRRQKHVQAHANVEVEVEDLSDLSNLSERKLGNSLKCFRT